MSRLILASGSASRRHILEAAGVTFEVAVPDVDEAALKASRLAKDGADAVATALAEYKALDISARRPGAWVIGGDQLLICAGRLFDKVAGLDAASDALQTLRGKEHQLVTAAVLARDGVIHWRHIENSRLWMRDFSDEFLDAYLVDEGEDVLSSVGCYRIEGRGAQLFDRVEGDHFGIRGLPLIPLLEALRRFEILPS